MKSFLQGKKSLSLPPLRHPLCTTAPALARHAPGPASAPSAAASAQVEVVKEGDKVVRLIISCVCGERVEIECLYSAGS